MLLDANWYRYLQKAKDSCTIEGFVTLIISPCPVSNNFNINESTLKQFQRLPAVDTAVNLSARSKAELVELATSLIVPKPKRDYAEMQTRRAAALIAAKTLDSRPGITWIDTPFDRFDIFCKQCDFLYGAALSLILKNKLILTFESHILLSVY